MQYCIMDNQKDNWTPKEKEKAVTTSNTNHINIPCEDKKKEKAAPRANE